MGVGEGDGLRGGGGGGAAWMRSRARGSQGKVDRGSDGCGIAGVGRQTNQNKCRTKKYPHFVLFSCRRFWCDQLGVCFFFSKGDLGACGD